jgi:hypothetical protein
MPRMKPQKIDHEALQALAKRDYFDELSLEKIAQIVATDKGKVSRQRMHYILKREGLR